MTQPTKPITEVGPWKTIGTATLEVGALRIEHVSVWVHDDAHITAPLTIYDFKSNSVQEGPSQP